MITTSTPNRKISKTGIRLIEADGLTLEITNPGKIIYPDIKSRKEDIIEYYHRIAPCILPHVEDRPISMERFPNGIHKEGFYQKEAGDYFPGWINIVEIPKEDGTNRQVMINNKATLLYLANQGNLTIHTWLSRYDKLQVPDKIVFDLDPPRENENEKLVKTAKCLRDILHQLEMTSFVMTSGSKGYHVVVPIERELEFEQVKVFASGVAELLQSHFPSQLTTHVRKQKRRGRIFIDVLRNAYAQTSVAPYSLRPLAGSPVATPLSWEELGKYNMHPARFNIINIFRRLGRVEDPWKNMNTYRASVIHSKDKLKVMMEKQLKYSML